MNYQLGIVSKSSQIIRVCTELVLDASLVQVKNQLAIEEHAKVVGGKALPIEMSISGFVIEGLNIEEVQ